MFFRNKMALAKLETSYGVDSNPTGSANAILTRNCDIQTFQGNKVQLNYDRPYFGGYKQIHTGPHTVLSYEVDIAGAGTAGTAPAYGPLLRAAGLTELINPMAVTGTAQGGSASTIQLAVSASAIDNTYNGFTIEITGGVGSGQSRVVKSYVGATKTATVSKDWTTPPDNTSTYSIGAQVVYRPISTGFESTSQYYFLDGELHKLLGVRGTVSFNFAKEQMPTMKFQFTGKRVAAAASANPTPVFTGFQEPIPVNDANTPTLTAHGYAARTESFTADLANKVVYRNVINNEEIMITDRGTTGSFAIEKPDLATKDFDAIIASQIADEIAITHGVNAGNIVELSMRSQLFDPKLSDSDGLVLLTMTAAGIPTDSGNDEFRLVVR